MNEFSCFSKNFKLCKNVHLLLSMAFLLCSVSHASFHALGNMPSLAWAQGHTKLAWVTPNLAWKPTPNLPSKFPPSLWLIKPPCYDWMMSEMEWKRFTVIDWMSKIYCLVQGYKYSQEKQKLHNINLFKLFLSSIIGVAYTEGETNDHGLFNTIPIGGIMLVLHNVSPH